VRVIHFGRFHDDNYGGVERHVAVLLDTLRVMRFATLAVYHKLLPE
jgi:hypothetical protein